MQHHQNHLESTTNRQSTIINKQSITALVLGASGQLGSDIVRTFNNEANISCIGILRQQFDALAFDPLADKYEGLNKYQPQYIINCIALTNVDGCEQSGDKALLINATFCYHLGIYCQERGITLIHISTDYVFAGDRVNYVYCEDDVKSPQNIYGISKLTGELLITNHMQQYFIFRVAGLFGPHGNNSNSFIKKIITLATDNEKVAVINDQISQPTSTLAVARVIARFISKQITSYGVYHCVSHNACSRFDFAAAIFAHCNITQTKLIPASFANYSFKAKRPQFSTLAIDKITHYVTLPSWQESLAEYFTIIHTPPTEKLD